MKTNNDTPTKCINHWAISDYFKVSAFNKNRDKPKVKCF